MGDVFEKVIGLIVLAVIVGTIAAGVGLLAAAGAAGYGAYALASAAGAGKALSIAAGIGGLIAGPVIATKSWKGFRKWKKDREDSRRGGYTPAFNSISTPSPAPAPAWTSPVAAPAPAAESPDNMPPVFTDAMEKLKSMDPAERIKYLDKLRDAFPNDVETLHGYDEKMALKKPATAMKPLTLVSKQNTSP